MLHWDFWGATQVTMLPTELQENSLHFFDMIYSLEYSCIVCDPHQQEDIDKLEGNQRRASRFITRTYRDRTPGIVTNMLHELKLSAVAALPATPAMAGPLFGLKKKKKKKKSSS